MWWEGNRSSMVLSFGLTLVILLITVLVVLISSAEGEPQGLFNNDANIVDLTTQNIEHDLGAEAGLCPWIVLFYNSYCGHCRAYAPKLSSFAATLDDQVPVLIGAINCVTHRDACSKMSIRGVPALFTRRVGGKYEPLSKIHDLAPHVASAVSEANLGKERRDACVQLRKTLKTNKLSPLSPVNVVIPKFVPETRLHQADVAAAVFLALRDEVPLVAHLDALGYAVLHDFISFIESTIPSLGVADLLNYVPPPSGTALSIQEWIKHVESSPIPYEGTPSHVTWRMCRGSSPQFRGLPCGMWLLFHTLLANASEGTAMRGLQIIRSYIQRFFSCTECKTHFMQIPFSLTEDATDNEALQWLWMAHNTVNARLAREPASSDPAAPKIQWPSSELCPRCRSGDKLNESAVLTFLKRYYRWNAQIQAPPKVEILMPRAIKTILTPRLNLTVDRALLLKPLQLEQSSNHSAGLFFAVMSGAGAAAVIWRRYRRRALAYRHMKR